MKKFTFSLLHFLILTLFFSLSPNSYSQFTLQWAARYNGTGNYMDLIHAIALDRFGYIYVTGEAQGGYSYASDYVTIKYSPAGDSLWVRKYNGVYYPNGSPDIPMAIAVDYNANVYVTGTSSTTVQYIDESTTIKYNSSGVQLWVARYSPAGGYDNGANSIVVDASGNIYIAGSVNTANNLYDYMTLKYNAYGILQWAQFYNGTGNGYDFGRRIKLDAQGNVYISGYSQSVNGPFDIVTVKYSNAGVQQWAVRYNGPANSHDYMYDFTVDNAGNSYIAGTTKDTNLITHFITIKYNTQGVQQWAVPFTGQAKLTDVPNAIVLDFMGNIYVTGSTTLGDNTKDLVVIKYNNNGEQQWVTTYNGINNKDDVGDAIALDKWNYIYVTGGTDGLQDQGYDAITVKYNNAGVYQCSAIYDGPTHLGAHTTNIAVDTNFNVYSAGYGAFNTVSGADYLTIKYSQPIGIKPISNNIPDKFELYQNYPNPFNPNTKIIFNISPLPGGVYRHEMSGRGGLVRLIIYDILGREITTLVNESLKPGTYEVEWDALNFPSGTYFYTLTTEGYRKTKAMILLK